MVLSNADYREARELRAKGHSLREIGRRIGCSGQEVWRIVREGSTRGTGRHRLQLDRVAMVKGWVPAPGHLSMSERGRGQSRTRAGRHVHGHSHRSRSGRLHRVPRSKGGWGP